MNRVHYIGTYGAFVGGRLKCMTQVWQDTGIWALEAKQINEEKKKLAHIFVDKGPHIYMGFSVTFSQVTLFTNCL